jgi:stearoyl-CoA desaturase (delta-9 desaturase)
LAEVRVRPLRSEPEGRTFLDAPRIGRWLGWHALLVLAPWFWDLRAVILMAGLGAFTMGFGLTVGVHRGLIHRAFRTGRYTERALVTIGALCGLGGPLGLSRMHHRRDYYQNQPACPPYFGYQSGFWAAMGYALFCRFEPAADPGFLPVWPEVLGDRYFQWLERWELGLQLPLALLCYLALGWPGVLWGVGARMALTPDGFWFIHYVSHRHGAQPFEIVGAAEQGRNVGWLSVPSLGESWHNNHHAYPQSARMGLTAAEVDPGYWLIILLRALGLVRDVVTPPALALRERARRRSSAGLSPGP